MNKLNHAFALLELMQLLAAKQKTTGSDFEKEFTTIEKLFVYTVGGTELTHLVASKAGYFDAFRNDELQDIQLLDEIHAIIDNDNELPGQEDDDPVNESLLEMGFRPEDVY